MPTRRDFLKKTILGAAALPLASLCPERATAAGRKSNLVFILADDAGYGDFSCFGAVRIKTPNIDRLAAEGVLFTDAYAPFATCTPTRYSLLTGEYAWRKPGTNILPGDAALIIEPGRPTLPALMKQAGYITGAVGKWHLGMGDGNLDFNGEIKPGPLEVGFDYFFGMPATGDRVPCVYIENHRVVNLDPNDPIKVSYKNPVGDDPTGKTHPEQLKMKLSAGHDGTIVNGISRIGFMAGGRAARWKDEDMADTFTKKAVEFMEKHKREPFFLYFCAHDPHVPRVPHPRFRGSSGCGVRGDVIQEFDACVGQVMAALDRFDVAENTLVIVTSDNGGVVDDGYADGAVDDLDGHRPNGPLRGTKYSAYEGGVRVPFVARWPARIKPGQASKAVVCLIDMAATGAALAGTTLPVEAAPDSFNCLPAIADGAKSPRETLILDGRAIRRGEWKYVLKQRSKRQEGEEASSEPPGELYNLADDVGETKDLSNLHPDLTKEFYGKLTAARQAKRTRS
jgi:arylsulfatase A-like enzyme